MIKQFVFIELSFENNISLNCSRATYMVIVLKIRFCNPFGKKVRKDIFR